MPPTPLTCWLTIKATAAGMAGANARQVELRRLHHAGNGRAVITNNADQSIQAYDDETGHQVWSKRLSGDDRTLRLVGASLVVMDYTDSNNDYGCYFSTRLRAPNKG